jgi:monoamine oxidase
MTTWDTTRAQPGRPGILVDYTGAQIAETFSAAKPYSDAASDPKVADYARKFLKQVEPVFPGIGREWKERATLSTPFRDPNPRLSYSYVKPGQTHT